MLRKLLFGAAASAAALTALPAAAQAQYYDRGYSDYRYERGGYRPYRPGDYYRPGYDRRYDARYDRGYDPRYDDRYGRDGYDPYYDDRRHDGYDDRYYDDRRCGDGTTGAIVGGAAGALIGREIGRDGRSSRSRYRRGGGGGTVGAIIGGAIGAAIGNEVAKGC